VNFSESLAWLYGLQGRGIKLGLEQMRDLLAAMGWEQGSAKFLHVAGTNGKGSVCAMLDAMCREGGRRTGLYTSPHLVTFRERIRINGEMVSGEEIATRLTRLRTICEREGWEPTFFELTTALAFDVFRDAALDVVVLETGLGGRLDSTNVIDPDAAAIVSIGLDHTAMLGDTLAQIAREKAGIIKPERPVVVGPMDKEALAVIRKIARERGAYLIEVREPLLDAKIGLKGMHQRINAALAIEILDAAGMGLTAEAIEDGLKTVSWPGRFQNTGNGFILDGAHNPQAARTLAATWREEFGEVRTKVILGMLQDKDAAGVCEALGPIAEEFIIVPVQSPRTRTLEDLCAIASRVRPSSTCNSLREALKETCATLTTPTLIAGSLFLIGEALTALGLAEGEIEISAQ
jgi:dihydrofolate synthase / folylpolyglutamate synthase